MKTLIHRILSGGGKNPRLNRQELENPLSKTGGF